MPLRREEKDVSCQGNGLGPQGDASVTRRVAIATASEFGDGDRLVREVEGRSILVCNTPAGLFALDNRCTHQESPLAEGRIRGCFIFCPLHGARFDLRDGMPLGTVATLPVRTYPVARVADSIEITLGDEPLTNRPVF
jgi:3-phenylpropionate/trans-cinnamate dioxygenase ferredoxin subunit